MTASEGKTADIVIVGGGIMGASLAWHLARRGAGRVTLLERSVIGAGASGKTGALLRRHYSNRPEAILAQRGWQTFAAWPELVGGAPVNEAFARSVGADAYCRDAAIAVETAKALMARRQGSAQERGLV